MLFPGNFPNLVPLILLCIAGKKVKLCKSQSGFKKGNGAAKRERNRMCVTKVVVIEEGGEAEEEGQTSVTLSPLVARSVWLIFAQQQEYVSFHLC